jgi:hypothetical protein
MRDMIDVLITHVHLLPDVLAVRRLSGDIYSWCREVPHRRLVGILHRFFQESLDHFLTMMHQTDTVATGSCALAMLLGILYDSSSSDLNLIVPHNGFVAMDVFLQKVAGYVTAEELIGPHSSVAPAVSRFVRYRKSHLCISLARAGVMGPMRVIACSSATADMTFMTAGGVATLYPEFTLHGRNVRNQNKEPIHEGECRMGTSKRDALAWESDTSFLGGPCGRSCPSLWRSTADYGPYGVFNWDARYDVKRILRNGELEFRIGERCVNQECERDCNKWDRLFWPPSPVVPADEIDIVVQEGNITNHQPVCAPSSLVGMQNSALMLPLIALRDAVCGRIVCDWRDAPGPGSHSSQAWHRSLPLLARSRDSLLG